MSMSRKSFIQKYYRFDKQNTKNGNNSLKKVRITMPFTLQCTFCSTFHFKGSKQISLKKLLKIEQTVNFFCFFVKCKKCNNEMSIGTDPIREKYYGISGNVYEQKSHSNSFERKQQTKEKKTLDQIEKELIEEIEQQKKA
ncbi:hypothetical protein M153_5170001305 [Pseudoloma neurophilia]|uniref:Splicing factor YJU2 n=1 Tax=Pseudoloma neurophilia TaxID=146866 RepID=A0A0R0M4Q7_9MICR|nr:hypothetical protein M153_5170001305 [Pseudoloma neurophilia]